MNGVADYQSSNNMVDKIINHERLLEADEDSIHGGISRGFSQSCNVVYEWVVRTPHVYPFNKKNFITKDIRGFSKYRESLITCANEVIRLTFQDYDFSESVSLETSPIVKGVFYVIKKLAQAMEASDPKMFDYLAQADMNFYKVAQGPEKERFEAEMNLLSVKLHKHFMRAGLRARVDSFKRNSKERYEQMMRVSKQVMSRHRSMLVSRLDWGYKFKVPDMRGRFESEEDYIQRFKQVSEYRKKMLKVLRKMYGKYLIFYAWKIECATVRGLHMHWLIGLNGSKHQDRINVPRAIADRWDEVLGLGEEIAYTRIINAHQQNEKALLRVIDYDDPLLWRIVGGYADYLTKVDYLVRHRTPKGMRSFGCTKFDEKVAKKKGPKRSKEMTKLDIAEVRRPLSELNPNTGSKGIQ